VTRLQHGGIDISTARPQARVQQGARDWYRIEMRAATDTVSALAEVWIYDEIGYFGVTASDFVRELAAVDSDKIVVHLNTPGGDAFDGIAIYGALKSHRASVEMRIDSLAASAGSFIAQAGDERVMARNATMMIHDAHGLVVGNAADMAQMVSLLDKTSDNVADIYAQRSQIGTVEDWRAAMKAETWYTADEAVAAGLADRVDDYSTVPGNSFDLAIFSYAGRQEAPAPVLPDPAPVVEQEPEPEVLDLGFIDALRGALA
jgi:ATP-dependent protease ClpP protease subunit